MFMEKIIEILTKLQEILTNFPLVISTLSATAAILAALIAFLQTRLNVRERTNILKSEILNIFSTEIGLQLWASKDISQIGITPKSISKLLDTCRIKRILPRFLWKLPFNTYIFRKYQKYKWSSLIHGALAELAKEGYRFDEASAFYKNNIMQSVINQLYNMAGKNS